MIKDSGNRTVFETGAVRDVQSVEKGRCDLLPLEVLGKLMSDHILMCIHEFQKSDNVGHLYDILVQVPVLMNLCDLPTMCLEVAVHMAEGAEKYQERNWELGIPVGRFIDSGVRHYLKWLRGDSDERHDRAFCWNIMCAIWTCANKPELDDYRKEKKYADNH